MARRPPPDAPSERHATVRGELRRVLREGLFTALELSARVGVGEKEIAGHLAHLARSVRSSGERLRVEPARCLACGFLFRKRDRLSKPSSCPLCKGQRLEPPRFALDAR